MCHCVCVCACMCACVLTTKPHDKLHAEVNLDRAEAVHQTRQREDVSSTSYQDKHLRANQ